MVRPNCPSVSPPSRNSSSGHQDPDDGLRLLGLVPGKSRGVVHLQRPGTLPREAPPPSAPSRNHPPGLPPAFHRGTSPLFPPRRRQLSGCILASSGWFGARDETWQVSGTHPLTSKGSLRPWNNAQPPRPGVQGPAVLPPTPQPALLPAPRRAGPWVGLARDACRHKGLTPSTITGNLKKTPT